VRISARLFSPPQPPWSALRGKASLLCGLFLFFVSAFLAPALAAEPGFSMMPDTAALLNESAARLPFSPDIIFGLFIGVMITASLYLFFIWVVLRERVQIFLMLLLVSLGLNMASTNGSVLLLLGLEHGTMIALLQSYSMIAAYILSLYFTSTFLELDTTAPMMKVPMALIGGVLVLLLVTTAFDQRPAQYLLPVFGSLAIGSILVSALIALWRGVSGSLSHLLAFSFFLLGGMAGSLYDLGFVPSEDMSKNLAYAGFALATILFAVVIAGQFAAHQDEKEKALQLSNERFSLAARGSNEGLFEWNRATGQVYFSGQFRKIMDVALESNLRGLKEWIKLIHPSDRKAIFATLRRFRDNGNAATVSFEYRVRHGANSWRWMHTKAVATRDPVSRRATRFVGSIGDITERKHSESRLRASEARFRSITEAHPVPVLIAALETGEILYASPGAETLLGLPSGILLTHKLDRFLPHADERSDLITAMSEGLNVDMREITLARGDGENIPAALSARRINYQNTLAMVVGLYDLTEQKKAQKKIADQQEALMQSEKMAALGSLLAGVAHELNNPLSVVMGQTSLLMDAPGEDKTKKRAEKIYKAADRCSRIVKSFLAVARRKPPERREVSLNPIIFNSLELLGYQFRNANVVPKLNLAEDLPPIIGDEDQMTQVFTNLALNAAQAMGDWSGKRELTITSTLQADGFVRLTYADTGPGISPDLRVRVFEPFFTTKGGTGGSGVGLSLCLNVVESHGGRIFVEETPGGGATFTVLIPSSKGIEAPQNEGERALVAQTNVTGKLRILIVDDEIELAQTLADLLEPFGHEIDLAANGAIALEKVEKKGFDVIISDLRMPVLDGPGLYAALAEKFPSYTKRIVYVTGDTLSTNVHAFLSQTPVPVIEKPYRLVDVQEALAKLLKETAG